MPKSTRPSRKLLWILLCLLRCHLLLAQSASEAEKAFERGEELRSQKKYSEAIPYFEKALEIDKSLGADRLSDTAFDHKALGLCYSDLSRFEEALGHYLKALELFKALEVRDQETQLLNNIGVIYANTGRYEKAIESYHKALEIGESRGSQTDIIRALNNLGLIFYYWGQYERTVNYYERAFEAAQKAQDNEQIPLILNNLGLVYYAWGRYSEALENYEMALLKNEELGQDFYAATNHGNIANVYLAWGGYSEAVTSYRRALEKFNELGDVLNATNTRINIGLVYYSWSRYSDALEEYEEAMIDAKRYDLQSSIAFLRSGMGHVYYATGKYDRAVENYEKSLQIFRSLNYALNVANLTSSIGMVYQAWGKYDLALEYYGKARSLAEELGAPDQVALNLRLIGSIYQAEGHYEKAIQHYTKSLEVARGHGREADLPSILNTLGTAYFEWGRYQEAIDHYNQALAIAQRIGKRDETARGLIHVGGVYQVWKKHEQALESYKRALAITREVQTRADEAVCLSNIGTVYLDLDDFETAARYFHQSIDIKEELRLTATGDIRRDFLASWISTYRRLILTYVRDNKPESAFDAVELVSAKYLAEQIGESLEESDLEFPGIRFYKNRLPEQTGVICFANFDLTNAAVLYADRDQVIAVPLDLEEFTDTLAGEYRGAIRQSLDKTRGLQTLRIEKDERDEESVKERFEKIIRFYRYLLSTPSLTKQEQAAREQIGRRLYTLLFESIETAMQGKSELIIIPDGILAFLPFETLVLADGRYMIEKYHIRYTQSLTISHLVSKRVYPGKRDSLLAFGGAVYDEKSYRSDMIVSEQQLENFRRETREALAEKRSTRSAYGALGIDSWENLPGSLTEVKSIGEIVEGSTIYTGNDVNESFIKQLSRQGTLARYRVLHFATHGIMVPFMPELSALVLSLFAREQSEDDGYLTMNEISSLRLQAEFVNLSACETGLGKIYGGEGVVGLTQSFLVAGANGLSVSLWQVADESTMKFMIGLYRLVQEKGLSYSEAMTEMKRSFIRKERLADPFFWAPFVYYGK